MKLLVPFYIDKDFILDAIVLYLSFSTTGNKKINPTKVRFLDFFKTQLSQCGTDYILSANQEEHNNLYKEYAEKLCNKWFNL